MLETEIALTGQLSTPVPLKGKLNEKYIYPDEQDPTVPQWVKNITEEDIEKWNSSDVEESDPTVPEYVKNITEEDIEKWNKGGSSYGSHIISSTSSTIDIRPYIEQYGAGTYIFNGNQITSLKEGLSTWGVSVLNNTFYITKSWSETNIGETVGFCDVVFTSGEIKTSSITKQSETAVVYSVPNQQTGMVQSLFNSRPATISGLHQYTVLPQSSVVPTTDNQFTNKSYVDSSIATAITGALESEY